MASITVQEDKQYEFYARRWARVRTIINGEYAMKRHDLSRIASAIDNSINDTSSAYPFLRYIMPGDTSKYNQVRNANFIKGAILYNATGRTANGLLGMLYRIDPTVSEDLPPQLDYLIENASGAGLSMDQQSKSISRDVIAIGRDGLLTDMPTNEDGSEVTRADVDNGFRPTIKEYKAESIIKWHEKVINGIKVLDLVVLRELVEVPIDGGLNFEDQINLRIIRLTEDGVTVQMMAEDGNIGKFEFSDDARAMVGAGNQKLTRIPFVFVGSVNNEPNVDDLPMEPISDVNVGHYRESANLAASSFNLSAAQPWIADDNYSKALRNQEVNGGSQDLGEESLIVLGGGGTFNLTSAPENSLASKLMEGYENQMVALGAQLITSSSGVETAEAARIKHSSDVSVLDTIASNVSDAYSKCLEFASIFLGIDYQGWRYELNRAFFETKLTPQDIAELVKLWQAGGISKQVLDTNLVKGKVIAGDVDLEEMNEMITEEMDMVNLDEPVTPPVVEV